MRHSAPLFLSLLVPCLPLAAQEKVALRYAFQPGQTTWLEMTQDMTQQMTMGEQTMNLKMTLTMWTENKVTEVKDGVAHLEARYARVAIKSDAPGQKIDYDSDVEGSKPGAQMRSVSELVGKTVKLQVDATGKVQSVDVADDLADSLEKSGLNAKQAFEQQFTSWPTNPVGIGDTWQSEMDLPMAQMGTMKSTITHKLVDLKDQVATIEQTMKMDTSALKLPPGNSLEVPKAGGTAKISLSTPVPIEATTEMVMKMGQMMTMTVRTAMKRVEAPAPKAAAKPADKAPEAPKTGGK